MIICLAKRRISQISKDLLLILLVRLLITTVLWALGLWLLRVSRAFSSSMNQNSRLYSLLMILFTLLLIILRQIHNWIILKLFLIFMITIIRKSIMILISLIKQFSFFLKSLINSWLMDSVVINKKLISLSLKPFIFSSPFLINLKSFKIIFNLSNN